MSLSKNLKLVSDQKPPGRSVTVDRRNRLAKAITAQIEQLKADIEGSGFRGRRKAPWYWLADDGRYFCSIKYGKKVIELEKGKFSIVSQSADELIDGLAVIRDLAIDGEFDAKLDGIAKSIRSNFKR